MLSGLSVLAAVVGVGLSAPYYYEGRLNGQTWAYPVGMCTVKKIDPINGNTYVKYTCTSTTVMTQMVCRLCL